MTFDFPQQGSSYIFDTWIPWPSILLCCCNHGNEILGVEIVKKIFNDKTLLDSLRKGKITWLLLNPKAYEQKKRLIDANLNRVRNMEWAGYEFTRRDEIKKFLQENTFDYCIDIHTTSKSYGVIGICDTEHLEIGRQVYDANSIWIDDLLAQGSFAGYFNSLWGVALGLEAGQHEDPASIDAGVSNIMQLLAYAGMIERAPPKKHHAHASYKFAKELFCATDKFAYAQKFSDLTLVAKGEVIWYDDQTPVINDLDGEIYFWLASNVLTAGDGIGFLFRKIS